MRKLEMKATHNFSGAKRILFFLAIICNIIYIGWRMFFTIPFGYSIWEVVFGVLLFVVELGGMLEMFSHFFGMSKSVEPVLPEIDEDLYPDVDIFVATCGEPVEILRRTLNGCVKMQYPDKNKVHIYLCDDKQKVKKENFSNGVPIKKSSKKLKDFTMEELATYMGVSYFSREERKGAKAGNLNNALEQTKAKGKASPIIVTFDADMVPMHDFLMKTVPFFLMNEQAKKNGEEPDYEPVGFVQTPQSFFNPDLFQFKLGLENKIPNEQDYFYREVQLARNASNAVIYGGSNTVISRQALEDVDGFFEETITEDFATGMNIEGKGYRCYGVDDVHASGESPVGLNELVKQRKRWARGCIHTLRKQKFVWGLKELDFHQKVSYTVSVIYWLASLKRIFYILAPVMFAVFGWQVIICNLQQVLIFWLPTYVVTALTLKNFSQGIRTTKWTNIYESIMFPVLVWPVIKAFFENIDDKFEVTKKGKPQKSKAVMLQMLSVFGICILLSIIGIYNMVMGIITANGYGYIVVLFWLCSNLISLLYCVWFLMKRTEEEWSVRFNAEIPFLLKRYENEFELQTTIITDEGFQFTTKTPIDFSKETDYIASFKVEAEKDVYECDLTVRVVPAKKGENTYTAYLYERKESDIDMWLAIVYDRLPSLPTVIDDPIGPFDDIGNFVTRIVDEIN